MLSTWLASPARGRSDPWVAAALAAVAAAALGAWWTTHPGACLIGADAAEWARATVDLREGDLSTLVRLRRQPGLPLLAALLPVEVPTALALVSAAATALTAALAWLVPGRLLGRGAGLVAVLALPALAWKAGAQANADALAPPLFLALAWGVARVRTRPTWRGAALLGAALALATLARPHALLLAPAVAWAAWPGGARALLAAGGAAAAVALPWQIVAWLHGGLGEGVLVMVVRDVLRLQPELARVAAADGAAHSPLALLVDNARRLWRLLAIWSPALASLGVAHWLARPDPRLRAHLGALSLCAAGGLLALPVLWQREHMDPFLLCLVAGGGAVVPLALARARSRRAWLALAALPLLPALVGPLHLRWAVLDWRAQSARRSCTPEVLDLAAWLGAHASPTGRNVLAHPNPAFQVYGAFDEAGLALYARALRRSHRDPPPEETTVWLPLVPDDPERARWERDLARGVLPRAVEARRVECAGSECLVLSRHVPGAPR